jgi:hypothetical protein
VRLGRGRDSNGDRRQQQNTRQKTTRKTAEAARGSLAG